MKGLKKNHVPLVYSSAMRLTACFTLCFFISSLAPIAVVAQQTSNPISQEITTPQSELIPETISEIQVSKPPVVRDSAQSKERVLARVEVLVKPQEASVISLGQMRLEIPAGAVKEEIKISLEELGNVENLDLGLENASVGAAGYRALPHGLQFQNWVRLYMGYNPQIVDSSVKRDHLYTYFYHDDKKVWEKLERVGVDESQSVVVSVTNHFTDFINGTLKSPDSAKPLGFNVSSIKDIKAANPASEISPIEGLEPSNTGSANFQIKLRLPSGRNGLEPQLALNYNSGGSSGWLGLGFDLSSPSISIDTRFGVPKYLGQDLYSFQGQDLIWIRNENNVDYFRPKVDEGFARIKRTIGSGHQYQWEVEEKNGTVTVYGGTLDSREGPVNTKDFVWYASEKRDANGNWVRWFYLSDEGHTYLSRIVYTGYLGESGSYEVRFVNESRPDRRLDVRGGWSNKMAKRLKSVDVYSLIGGETLIRRYELVYEETIFGKSVVKNFREVDGQGNEFYKYVFDRHSVAKSGDKILGWDSNRLWGANNGKGDFDSSFNTSLSGGVGFSGGLKWPFFFSLGGNWSSSRSENFENSKLMDINGDGVADILEHKMKTPSLSLGSREGGFTSQADTSQASVIWDAINQAMSEDDRRDAGFSGAVGAPPGSSFSLSYAQTTSKSQSKTKWSYMDIDGDGLVDIVGNSGGYYKNISDNHQVKFEFRAYGTSGGNTPLPLNVSDEDNAKFLKQYHRLDPLRMLSAYRDGTVSVWSEMEKPSSTRELSGWDGVRLQVYVPENNSVRLAEAKIINQTGTQSVNLPDVVVRQNEPIVFRVNSVDKVSNDEIQWHSKVRYKTIRLFSHLTNQRYTFLPKEFELNAIPNEPDVKNAYRQVTSGSFPNIRTFWELNPAVNDSIKETARIKLKELGYVIYQKLDFDQVKNSEVLKKSYEYDTLERKMILKESVKLDNTTWPALYDACRPLTVSQGQFSPTLPGQWDADNGKLVYKSTRKIALHRVADSVGFHDFNTGYILVEKNANVGGGLNDIHLRPVLSGSSWQALVKKTGVPSFDAWVDSLTVNVTFQSATNIVEVHLKPPYGEERFYKLSVGSLSFYDANFVNGLFRSQISSTLTTSQMNQILGFADDSQSSVIQSAYTLSGGTYTLNTSASNHVRDTVLWFQTLAGIGTDFALKANSSFWYHTQGQANDLWSFLRNDLSLSEMNQVKTALTSSWDRIRFERFFENNSSNSDNFHLRQGLVSDEKAFILWAMAKGNVLANPQNWKTVDEYGVAYAPSPIDALLVSTFNQTQWDQMLSLVAVKDRQRLTNLFLSTVSGGVTTYQLKTDASVTEADKLFVLVCQKMASVITQGELQKGSVYIPKDNSATNTVFHSGLQSLGILAFSNLEAIRSFDSQTMFEVSTRIASQALRIKEVGMDFQQDGGFRNILAGDEIDVVTLLGDGQSSEEIFYVHRFDSKNDINGQDVLDEFHNKLEDTYNLSRKTKVELENLIFPQVLSDLRSQRTQMYAGGGWYWFYGEWQGELDFNETLLDTQRTFTKPTNKNEDQVKRELEDPANIKAAQEAQVLWKMKWGQPEVEAPVEADKFWHGMVKTTKGTSWDPSRNRAVETAIYEYSYIKILNVKPYRVGGDEGLQKAREFANTNTKTTNGGLAWVRESKGESTSKSPGITIAGFSAGVSYSSGDSNALYDLMDVNGDRLPDLIKKDGNDILVYLSLGSGFSTQAIRWGGGDFRQFINKGLSASGSAGTSMATIGSLSPSGATKNHTVAPATAASISPSMGFNLGVSPSVGASYKFRDVMDINGDGLPDQVWSDGNFLYFNLNTGYGFGETKQMTLPAQLTSFLNNEVPKRFEALSGGRFADLFISESEKKSLLSLSGNKSESVTVGASVGGGPVSAGASVSISGSTNRSYFEIMDINGDGLSDLVYREDGALKVCFNQGDQFMSPQTWGSAGDSQINILDNLKFYNPQTNSYENVNGKNLPNNPNDPYSPWILADEISSSTSVNFSLNGNLSVTFSWFFMIPTPWPPFGIPFEPFVSGSVNGSGGFGSTSVQSSVTDVNGDGLLDSVISVGGNLAVRLNTLGQEALVHTIHLPQGGRYSLEYERTPNTTSDASPRWVMSRVTKTTWETAPVVDGVSLPNLTLSTSYEYEDGYYDRQDRRFWGYQKVSSIQSDGKKTRSLYDNRNFELKDKPYEVTQFDALGISLEKQSTRYDVETLFTDASGKTVKWPRLRWVKNESFDGSLTLEKKLVYQNYDAYANPTLVYEELNSNRFRSITIEYQSVGSERYLASLPTLIEVKGAQGNLLRKRAGSYNEKGDLVWHREFYSTNNYVQTDFVWDVYGNLIKRSDGHSDIQDRYELNYIYDSTTHSKVLEVSDNLGQRGSWTYNYNLGVETSQTDTSGKVIFKNYDAFGRLVEVKSPYDTGSVSALSFEYTLSEFPWKAITRNKVKHAADDSQVIRTILFMDGQGRVIQTKKESVVRGVLGWTVSGWVVLDDLGREKQSGLTGFDANANNLSMKTQDVVKNLFSTGDYYNEKTYDNRDRVTQMRLPDGSTQSTSYQLYNLQGKTVWKLTNTDPMGRQKESLLDGQERILQVVLDPLGKALKTKFTYDDLGQLLTTEDHQGNRVFVEYDVLGRKTALISPDAGRTAWRYNEKGDLWEKTDEKLRRYSQAITYEYEKHRLKKEKSPDGEITYIYGTSSALNNVGRVIEVNNGFVKTQTEYGKLGEVTGVTRTIQTMLHNRSAHVYHFGFAENYLGQMERIDYPNGEVLSYTYDAGGNVTTVRGVRDNTTFHYVDNATYDEFGQRVRMEYGNGTTTNYVYDTARRWLVSSETKSQNDRLLLKQEYSWNVGGDVLTYRHTSDKKTITQNYTYDVLDQLIGAEGTFLDTTSSLHRTARYSQSLSYDNIGNITRKTSDVTRAPQWLSDAHLRYDLQYSYDPAHAHRASQVGKNYRKYDLNGNLTEVVPDYLYQSHVRVVPPPPIVFTFGADGIMYGDRGIGMDRNEGKPMAADPAIRYYTWNWHNQLTALQEGPLQVFYTYDAGGERRTKRYDKYETVYADRFYTSQRGTDRPLGSVHIYVGQERVVTKVSPEASPSLDYEQQNRYFYHSDHIGSTSLVTDYQGADFERTAFTPHGEVWVDESADSFDKVDVLFTGKALEAESGLYNFGSRLLDPKTGLWLSVDPALADYIPSAPINDENKESNKKLPGLGGVYNSLNLAAYHYVGNNPIRYRDSDGRETQLYTIGKYDVLPYHRSDFKDWPDYLIAPIAIVDNAAAFVVNATTNAIGHADDALKSVGLDPMALGPMGPGPEIKAIKGLGTGLRNLSKLQSATAIIGNKLDYILGKATGTTHNISRSQGMLRSMEKIGLGDSVTTRNVLSNHLNKVLNDSSSIIKTQSDGRVVRQSLLMGPNGAVKLESVWEGNKLITVKIFEGE